MAKHDVTRTPQAEATAERKEVLLMAAGYSLERPHIEGDNSLPFFLCLNGEKVIVTWPYGNQSRLFASEDCPELRAFAAAVAAAALTPSAPPSMEAVERAIAEYRHAVGISEVSRIRYGMNAIAKEAEAQKLADLLALIRALPGAGAGDQAAFDAGADSMYDAMALRSDAPTQGRAGGGESVFDFNAKAAEMASRLRQDYGKDIRGTGAVRWLARCLEEISVTYATGDDRVKCVGRRPFPAVQHLAPAPGVPADVAGAYEDAAQIADNPEAYYACDIAAAIRQRAQSVAVPDASPSRGAMDVLAERRRQVEAEAGLRSTMITTLLARWPKLLLSTRWCSQAGIGEVAKRFWPWDFQWWKPASPRRNLVKAGALIIADIERLDRLDARIEKHFPAPQPEGARPQPHGEG